MLKGTVKWFNSNKGFGFIEINGTDYFVHYKDIEMTGYKNLKDGQTVEFTAIKTPKGMTAKEVRAA